MNNLYQNISQEKGRLFAEVKKIYLEKLPIPQISEKDQQPFVSLADKMLQFNKDLQEIKGKFLRMLQRKFAMEKPSTKLQNWHELSFGNFIKELTKAKIKLSLSEEAEWEEYFLAEQQKAQIINTQITKTDREINEKVYELYGITDEYLRIFTEK